MKYVENTGKQEYENTTALLVLFAIATVIFNNQWMDLVVILLGIRSLWSFLEEMLSGIHGHIYISGLLVATATSYYLYMGIAQQNLHIVTEISGIVGMILLSINLVNRTIYTIRFATKLYFVVTMVGILVDYFS